MLQCSNWQPGGSATGHGGPAVLRRNNVVSEQAIREGRTLTAFGIAPAAMEVIVPAYLERFRKTGQFKVRLT